MTKKIQRFFVLLLSLALALGLCVPALADDVFSITLQDNSTSGAKVAGKTFNAYHLFSFTAAPKEGGGYLYGDYSYAAPWVDTMFQTYTPAITTAEAAAAYIAGLTADGAEQFAADVGDYIANNGIEATRTVTAGETDSSVTFSDMDMGYYIVKDMTQTTSTTVSACMLNYNNPSVTIDLKADPLPALQKTIVGSGAYKFVATGDAVPFALTTTLPSTQHYRNYALTMTDTMTTNLELQQNTIQVTVGTTVYSYHAEDGKFYQGTTEEPSLTLTSSNPLTIGMALREGGTNTALYEAGGAGAAVSVNYSARFTGNVAETKGSNSAQLSWRLNNHDYMGTLQQTNVYTTQIDLTKLDAASEQPITTGSADFAIYGTESARAVTPPTGVATTYMKDGVTYYFYALQSTAAGVLAFPGLETGTYQLVETKAPAGYNLLTDSIRVVLTGLADGGISYQVDEGEPVTAANRHAALAVGDSTGVLLPPTGGNGFNTAARAGAVLILLGGAGLLILPERKHRFEEKKAA